MPSTNLVKLMYNKKEFLILVFSNLLVQLGITYYISQQTNDNKINFWLLLISQIIVFLILILIPMNMYLKFILFCLYSYITGLIFRIIQNKYDKQAIQSVLVSTMAIFGIMCATGLTLLLGGIKLGIKFGAFLFWSLLTLIILQIVLLFNKGLSNLRKIVTFIGIMIFSVYIVFDTNVILQRNYNGDFITASLDYYLDIINLFLNLLGSNNE